MEPTAQHVSNLLTRLAAWAPDRGDLLAVGVVGSFARGMGRPDSDLDLILLTSFPERYLRERSWLSTFGEWLSTEEEEWGEITSLRVSYRTGLEVEFGVGRPAWASLPPDEGTRQVVSGGLRPIYDPLGLLQRLQEGCSRTISPPGGARRAATALTLAGACRRSCKPDGSMSRSRLPKETLARKLYRRPQGIGHIKLLARLPGRLFSFWLSTL